MALPNELFTGDAPQDGEQLAQARLSDLRAVRLRYVALLDAYVAERSQRLSTAGVTGPEADMVLRPTLERWSL